MHSIRTKMASLTISAILICSLLIGIVSVLTVKSREEESSERLMHVICEAECDEINNFLSSIEEALGTVIRFIYEGIDTVDLYYGGVLGASDTGVSLEGVERSEKQRKGLEQYLRSHLSDVQSVFETVASNNTSVLGYYYRLNPEFSDTVDGLWYSRHNTARFMRQDIPDLHEYSSDDFAHSGWYYLPIERGGPSWLEPYKSENLGETVVSYSTPVYKSGTFIGVIGIDVRYSTLTDKIDGLKILDTGYAFLTDSKGKILYHPTLENGTLLSNVNEKLTAAGESEGSTELIAYSFNGTDKRAAWHTLSNGMRLVVTAPEEEVDPGWRNLLWFIIVALALILTIFIVITLSLMKRITSPLENLAQASEQVIAGNYDVVLTYRGKDELGTLTKAFVQMLEYLKTFIQDLNSRAYKDALTNVRNKGAFAILIRNIDDQIKNALPGNPPCFAVAMFDCNNLKKINDSYGHEKGDIYLRAACTAICKVYSHSPVFRIGGDEFAVILQNEDFANHDMLEKSFSNWVSKYNETVENDWEKVSLAHGMAVYEHGTDPDVEAVLNRADQLMYTDKKRMKDE